MTQRRAQRSGSLGSEDEIRIRMYRVGFGDCFLVSMPGHRGTAHILIDCGVHPHGDLGVMPEVVSDIASVCDRHLNLVIATQAHLDHISGFSECEAEFRQFTIDEVWLPWTENDEDDQANGILQQHIGLARTLRRHFEAIGMTVDGTAGGDAFAAVANSEGDPAALALLKSGINGAKVRYVKAGQTFDDAAGIDGLRIRILGPACDPNVLARMNLPTADRFYALDGAGRLIAPDQALPFADKWTSTSVPAGALDEHEKEILSQLTESSVALAFALHQAINNTSVVALLTQRGKNLLFPGDAQFESWESLMNLPQGAPQLARIDFLKVAHHGSCNATPKNILETMRDGFVAMIPTQDRPWPSIPSETLIAQLEAKASAVIRSDSMMDADATEHAAEGSNLGLEQGSGASFSPLWCDYTIRL